MMSFHSGQEMLMMIDCVCNNDNNGVCNCACDVDNNIMLFTLMMMVIIIIVIIGDVVHDDVVDDGVD